MSLFIIKNTIKSESKFILIYLLNTLLLIALFNQLLSKQYLLYPFILSIFLLLGYLIFMCIHMFHLFQNMPNNKIANYAASYSTDYKDELYLAVIKDLHFDYNRKLNALSEKNRKTELLFSQFIHNMKTSVSVIELASTAGLEKFDGISTIDRTKVLEDIVIENRKLKEQLEQSLNILRLDKFSQDYVPEKHDLLELVKCVINNNKTNFIYNSIYPKIVGSSTFVFTDKKWLLYLINQVLSNAIKYTQSGGTVTFHIVTNRESTKLQITDTGVGIPAQDMDRIFELFYTGDNGRNNTNSTGIGLSMVKTVANLLNHEINISSQVNIGTTFEITFLTKM